MKKLLFCSLLIALLQLPVSCAFMDDAAQTGTALKFDKVYFYPHPSDVPGCSQVIASTSMSGGGNYTEYIMLSFCFYETTEVGKELELERMMFGLPLSSDSRDYVHSFSGKMILEEKTGSRAVIQMKDVHFKILHGEYVLNGDLVATVK